MGITEILGAILVLIVGAASAFFVGKSKGKTEQKKEIELQVSKQQVDNSKTVKEVNDDFSKITDPERDALASKWMRDKS